jgi:hypothetical protein
LDTTSSSTAGDVAGTVEPGGAFEVFGAVVAEGDAAGAWDEVVEVGELTRSAGATVSAGVRLEPHPTEAMAASATATEKTIELAVRQARATS